MCIRESECAPSWRKVSNVSLRSNSMFRKRVGLQKWWKTEDTSEQDRREGTSSPSDSMIRPKISLDKGGSVFTLLEDLDGTGYAFGQFEKLTEHLL